MNPKGRLIVVEGIDGSGKTTFSNLLYSKLKQRFNNVFLTKEPGGTKFGTLIRSILENQDITKSLCKESNFLLFAADRAQHIQEVVEPYISKGYIVISDRMDWSSITYQGCGYGVDISMINNINKWLNCSIEKDLTFYLAIDQETAQKRLLQRGKKLTMFEKATYEFWKRVIKGYEDLCKNNSNVEILDAKQDPDLMIKQAIESIEKRDWI